MSQRINLVQRNTQTTLDPPNFLDFQLKPFKELFEIDSLSINREKEELYKIFQASFPIIDTKKNFTIEFINYSIYDPLYTPEECIEKKISYSVQLKVHLRFTCKVEEGVKVTEEELLLGNIPYMTLQGSFIINGKERVVVPQIHRSYGVFFIKKGHLKTANIYSAKIIPFRGVWIEFVTDMHGVLYAYIDRIKKVPLTLLLRSLGYGTDSEILGIFDLVEEVKVAPDELAKCKGRKLGARVLKTWIEDFVDEQTGEVISINRSEVLVERGTVLDKRVIETICSSKEKKIFLQKGDSPRAYVPLLYKTFEKDDTNSEKEAIREMHRLLRNTELPDEQFGREFINQLFFNEQRSFLGKIGRYCINKRLKHDVGEDNYLLTKKDILETAKRFADFIDGKFPPDDIDHFGGKRVRLVKEQLQDVINQGMARMVRSVREGVGSENEEELSLSELINTRALYSAIQKYFNVNSLCQYMDQTNLLSELSHKRRLSLLGEGGLSKENTSVEARDIQVSQYGRICPVQTPEGRNIGVILAAATHAQVDDMGFMMTPYRPVVNGKIDTSKMLYLTVEHEEKHFIAEATIPVDGEGNILDKELQVRHKGEFVLVEREQVTLIDVSEAQSLSLAAALIPFIGHSDPTRILMGANMQRQAIPLLQPEAPIVGTGLEKRVVEDLQRLPMASRDGSVVYVDGNKIVIEHDLNERNNLASLEPSTKTYRLKKLVPTNHDTCISLRPIVAKGDRVKEGQILCEGYGTQGGELALGRNLFFALMSWQGYNYEDGIVVSDRVVREDIFTSIQIEEFSQELAETRLGPEEFTREIPNVSEEAIKNLDEDGIVRVGTKVKEGDILIGKIIPQAETELSPERALLQAIFGQKACNVRDVSLKAPPFFEGTVVETKLFSHHPRTKEMRANAAKKVEKLKKTTNKNLAKLKNDAVERVTNILKDVATIGVYDRNNNLLIEPGAIFTKDLITTKIFEIKEEKVDLQEARSIRHVRITHWTENEEKNNLIKSLLESYIARYNDIIGTYKKEKVGIEVGDELPFGVLKKAQVRIARKSKLKEGDKLAGRYGNKGIVAKIAREEDMPYLPDGTRVDVILNPIGIPSRMNIGQLYEGALAWAGKRLNKKYAVPVFGNVASEIDKEVKEANLPPFCSTTLYDGCTGEPFEREVTCGVMYLLRLNHLAEKKMHARSTGPYALITQQPLGGRSQFGGQRLGGMEADAVAAYGASATLREFFTLKSDDVVGRKRTYEAIVKGEKLPDPGLPEAFKVLRQELMALCIDLKLI